MANSPACSPGRVGGIDYGTVRIGIAISDPDRRLASPLENYTRRTVELDGQLFRRLAREYAIVLWVVGLPAHLDGRESQKSAEARRFGQWLGAVTGLPVEFFDERFTSAQAEELLQAAELTNRRRKQRRDMLAAQIMLASYLEAPAAGSEAPRAIDD